MLTIVVSSVSTVLAPYALGRGIGSLMAATDRTEFLTTAGRVAIVYSLLWLVGSSLTYVIYPLYGLVEQRLQSTVMARALKDSITADPSMRHQMDNGEISFAIDTNAGTYRDSLAGLYLSVFPAVLSLVAGVWAVVVASSWVEGLIVAAAAILYAVASKPLIAAHQKAQAAFFKENMRSFGVLGNSLGLWKEAVVFSVPQFLYSRYRSDRVTVEKAGAASYAATRRLYLAQGLILAATICTLVFTISYRTPLGDGQVIGAIVSTVGIAVAAIGPLQTVGFGISSLAVAISQQKESSEKIRPHRRAEDVQSVVRHDQVAELSKLLTQPPHRPIWVLGESGTGKTTLLEGLLGLNSSEVEVPRSSGYVQQSPGLLNATAVDNVIFGRDISREAAGDILSTVGLESFAPQGSNHSRDVAGEEGKVSGGERQRIAIARALVSDGDLVVLDEPTSGLDASSRAKVWALIERCAQDRHIVVATHDDSAPIREDDLVFRPSRVGAPRS
ncbi:ABC transporter ATP-binding protein [Corynebacterium lizhenjunii]|uniref:ABC transporter ATP-binding protein n=1 Tax=Corynebacterium lizhenjunii TaxID=2709394 RepID=UPI00246804EA|nr:ABC transporter ATP-binding protein [Corynebacterium lizhenjunii]